MSVLTHLKEALSGGLADGRPDSDFDPQQLAAGIRVELEHTDNPAVAKEIAKDHLAEDPHYYVKLKKIESERRMLRGARGPEQEVILEDHAGRKLIVTINLGISSSTMQASELKMPEKGVSGDIIEIKPLKVKEAPKVDYAITVRDLRKRQVSMVGVTRETHGKLVAAVEKAQKAFEASSEKKLKDLKFEYEVLVAQMNGNYEELTEEADRAHQRGDTEKAFALRKERDKNFEQAKRQVEKFRREHPEVKAR